MAVVLMGDLNDLEFSPQEIEAMNIVENKAANNPNFLRKREAEELDFPTHIGDVYGIWHKTVRFKGGNNPGTISVFAMWDEVGNNLQVYAIGKHKSKKAYDLFTYVGGAKSKVYTF